MATSPSDAACGVSLLHAPTKLATSSAKAPGRVTSRDVRCARASGLRRAAERRGICDSCSGGTVRSSASSPVMTRVPAAAHDRRAKVHASQVRAMRRRMRAGDARRQQGTRPYGDHHARRDRPAAGTPLGAPARHATPNRGRTAETADAAHRPYSRKRPSKRVVDRQRRREHEVPHTLRAKRRRSAAQSGRQTKRRRSWPTSTPAASSTAIDLLDVGVESQPLVERDRRCPSRRPART